LCVPDAVTWPAPFSDFGVTDQDIRLADLLEAMRLDRIRTKLLAFAVVIAILPALATAWVSYASNKRTLRERIAANLEASAQQAARETDLWFRERLHELRVFASSYEVIENLEGSRRGSAASRTQIREYLGAIRGRFGDYLQLQANSADGKVVAVTPAGAVPMTIEPSMATQMRGYEAAFGAVALDSTGRSTVVLAVPVAAANGRVLGFIAVRLQLGDLADALAEFATAPSGGSGGGSRLLLMQLDGSVTQLKRATRGGPDSVALGSLLQSGGGASEFVDRRGNRMLGAVAQMSNSPWFAVAEVPQATAYRELNRLRNVASLAILALALALGGVGYVIGLRVVRPIDSLTRDATGVARGDLDVELPIVGRDEVASLTEVFNDMVQRLREDRRQIATMEEQLRRRNMELEELSITDGLTGLRNRRHMVAALDQEVDRARRSKRPLSVLMLDVDHFKRLNDRFGHQAGDAVLVKVAGLIRAAVRGVDAAGRYGGEEFIVVLPETDQRAAEEVAERIRSMVAGGVLLEGGDAPVTVSIGIATLTKDGGEAAEVIARADAALYRAKAGGRNRVEVSGGEAVESA